MLHLSDDDVTHGWTTQDLLDAHARHRRGDRDLTTVDGNRRYHRAYYRARRTPRRSVLDLGEVLWLLAAGESLEQIAARLGRTRKGIIAAVRERGTSEQKTRFVAMTPLRMTVQRVL